MKLFFIAYLLALAVAYSEINAMVGSLSCLSSCQDVIEPCLSDPTSSCSKAYMKCLQRDDPSVCFASVNGVQMNRITQCFEVNCAGINQLMRNDKRSG